MFKHLSFLLVFFSASASFAQTTTAFDKERENFFRFGAKVGLNINKFQGRSYKEAYRYNFQAGGFLQFNMTERVGLQPEVNFVQASSEFSTNSNDVYDDLFGGGAQNSAKLNYLEVPLFLNVNIGPSKRVKLQVGPAYGGLLKQTVDSLKTPRSIYKNNEWSAIGGLWLQLPLVNLGARYKVGFTNINGIDNRETWKNQSFQIFAGVTF